MGKTFGVGEPWLNSCLEFKVNRRETRIKTCQGPLAGF